MLSMQTPAGLRPLPSQSRRHSSVINGQNKRICAKHLLKWKLAAEKPEQATLQTDGAAQLTTQSTLDSLDALLGVDKSKDAVPEKKLQGWWTVPPKQTAPPRTSAMRPGVHGRFLSLDLEGVSELRSGKKTAAGEALDIPQVQPFISYALLLANIAVFASVANVSMSQGPESAAEFAGGLQMSAGSLGAGEWWRLGTTLLMHSTPLHLAADLATLALLAPRCEALLGYCSFAAVVLLSGVTGSVAASYSGCSTADGGSWGVAGLAVALLVYMARNRQVVPAGMPPMALSAALLAALAVVQSEGTLPALGAALAAGLWLGSSMGPRLTRVTELDIPDGSMAIPDNATELYVVLDQTSNFQKATAAVSFCALLAAAAAITALAHH